MRAIVKLAPRDGAMSVVEKPEPVRAEGDVLIRIGAGGICGTDVAIWKWHEAVVGQYAPTFPVVVGHEFSGTVEQAPANSTLKRGDVVAINPQLACGKCRYCGLGRPTLCDDRRLMGGHIDGGWTEMVSVPEKQVYRLPDGIDTAVAPLLEPMAVAVHAVFERVPVQGGDLVAVIGAGPIGLLAGLLALHAGASDVLITGVAADRARGRRLRDERQRDGGRTGACACRQGGSGRPDRPVPRAGDLRHHARRAEGTRADRFARLQRSDLAPGHAAVAVGGAEDHEARDA